MEHEPNFMNPYTGATSSPQNPALSSSEKETSYATYSAHDILGFLHTELEVWHQHTNNIHKN
jgi:hypothetical protein